MTTLAVDLESVRLASRRIDEVLARFTVADSDAAEAAAHVGHDDLAATVLRFAEAWEISRTQLVGALTGLRDHLTAIADTFERLDGDLAGELNRMLDAPFGDTIPAIVARSRPTATSAPAGGGARWL